MARSESDRTSKIPGGIEKTPYDGISPESIENNEADCRECGEVSHFRFKGKVRSPMSEVRTAKRGPTSCLLTPVSCSFKNEGDSGDVDENKGTGKSGVRYQVPGVTEKSEVPRSEVRRHNRRTARRGHSVSWLLNPVACTSKMKVTPGMLMKAKQRENEVSGIRCQVSAKSPKFDVRSPKAKPPNVFAADILSPDSRLLTPAHSSRL